jgi:hypothetical protein
MADSALSEGELRFLRALNARGVRFLLVGMSGALVQGARGATEDIDLWFESTALGAISSGRDFGTSAFSSTWTWSRPRPDLVPTWSRLGPRATTAARNVTVTTPASSVNSGGAMPWARQDSITRLVPRPQAVLVEDGLGTMQEGQPADGTPPALARLSSASFGHVRERVLPVIGPGRIRGEPSPATIAHDLGVAHGGIWKRLSVGLHAVFLLGSRTSTGPARQFALCAPLGEPVGPCPSRTRTSRSTT